MRFKFDGTRHRIIRSQSISSRKLLHMEVIQPLLTSKPVNNGDIQRYVAGVICVSSSSRVAVITGTTGQAIFVHLACAIIGCSAVAVNGSGTVDEIWQIVDLSESTHLIVEPQFMQKADDVRRKAAMRGGGRIKHIRIIDDVLTADSINSNGKKRPPLVKDLSLMKITALPSEETHAEAQTPLSEGSVSNTETGTEENSEPHPEVHNAVNSFSGQNPLMIFFTSGTTGLPKAAEFAHRSLIINLQQLSIPLYGPVQPRERFLLPLSLSHMFGVISAYYALVNGATVYMMTKVSPKTLVDNIVNLNINVAHITPAMVMWLAMDATLETLQVNSLRSMLVAGAPTDANLANHAKRKMNLKDLRQCYGMTELGGLCTLSPYECEKIESVGAPLPGMLFKIVSWDTKQLCPPRTPGQLMVIGPQVAPCYFRNPKATAEILDANGYVKTGDAAFYDETGNIYVLDRMKDIIKYKGTLVCPSEVELTLRVHPGVDDCAVVGRQDHVSGEVPAAFVVKNAAYPLLSSAEVRQYVSGKIPSFKELRGGVFFIPEIPRSLCGKVIRRQLRQFWDRERTNSKDVIMKDGKAGKMHDKKDKPTGKNSTGTTSPTKGPSNRQQNKRTSVF
ncbi:Acyl-CoA synthetase family member 2 mitochondrial [Trichostrongylus colubriformis]|uniref:Acyl-CoA synthetase family member 2 mitochondrial n=1 Tax=Trichostrongylus colubriformis TaxID=6319 RepID=A0AAN8FG95_TRICO